MRNFFLTIVVCALALGFSTTVYAFPSMGSDCSQCHGGGGGGGNTPGCGSSGCNRRLLATDQALEISDLTKGYLATEITEEEGFTLIHPSEMNPAEQVVISSKKLTQTYQRKLEKIASWGVVIAVPGQGQGKKECAALLDKLNNDSTSKFFDKLDMDSIIEVD